MERVTVIGSGASGVHFALTLLRKGVPVTLIDAGGSGARAEGPDVDFEALKEALSDPAEYFLGPNFEAVIFPDSLDQVYEFPPAKRYVFRRPPGFDVAPEGFEPLQSYAQGGLAEAWTAGVYPFNDAELELFPFSYEQLGPRYAEIARRIGITGRDDDLARFMPVHDPLDPPLDLDGHALDLLHAYDRRRRRLNERLGVFMGLSRVATLSRDRGERRACTYLGRCLWGCPRGSLYTPSITLAECRGFPQFDYRGGLCVEAFRYDGDRRITAVVARPIEGGEAVEMPVGALALAAGTLGTTRIVLESLLRVEGERPRLGGLMDNRQVLVPFVNVRRIGRPYEAHAYQYHQVCVGLAGEEPFHYVHGQVTTLTTALVHPILQRIPLDARTALLAFRHLRGALGIVNLNLHDTRRPGNQVQLEAGPAGSTLRLAYAPSADEPERLRGAVGRLRRALRQLGCLIPPGGVQARPMGASVHYAGTLPMSRRAAPFTTSPLCRSHDFRNLWIVDGSTFPFLPAKNITFTLMANAVRVAEEAF